MADQVTQIGSGFAAGRWIIDAIAQGAPAFGLELIDADTYPSSGVIRTRYRPARAGGN